MNIGDVRIVCGLLSLVCIVAGARPCATAGQQRIAAYPEGAGR